MKITLEHARSYPCMTRSGYCARGMRKFAGRYNLDWQKFITEGIDEEVLLATGDSMAERIVEWVKENYGR